MSDRIKNIRLSDGGIIKFEQVGKTASTAEIARVKAEDGASNMHVIFAKERLIESRKKNGAPSVERGIYLSCILRPSFFPKQAEFLAPLAMVALVSALEEHTEKKLGIAWPGYVFCDGCKIGSVDFKSRVDKFSSYEYLIITFSVRMDEKNFPPRLGDMVRKVFESDNDSIEMIIATTILKRFSAVYTSLKTPEKYMDIYSDKFILLNKKIKYLKDGKKKSCRVHSFDKTTGTIKVEAARGRLIDITSPSEVLIPNKIR